MTLIDFSLGSDDLPSDANKEVIPSLYDLLMA